MHLVPAWPALQLGKSKAVGRDFLESLKAEGEAVEDVTSAAAAAGGSARDAHQQGFMLDLGAVAERGYFGESQFG